MKKITLLAFSAALFFGAGAAADDDLSLQLNGKFRHESAEKIYGWNVSGGKVRLTPEDIRKKDEFILELSAGKATACELRSDLHKIKGRLLKIEAKLSGSGRAAIGFTGFGADGSKVLTTERHTVNLDAKPREVERYFPLNAANLVSLRIVITAEPGSVVCIEDVEAEFKQLIKESANSTKSDDRQLVNDKRYFYAFLSREEKYQCNLAVGGEIEFEIGEKASDGKFWQVVNEPRFLRVKVEHDQDGTWPLRDEKAEVEIEAVAPGSGVVELTDGDKRFIINVNVK